MNSKRKKFIAYDAYERLADAYAEMVDTKPHNAYLARPATLSLLPAIEVKRVLDAGCGPGIDAQWLLVHGAHVVAVDGSPRMVAHAKRRLGDRANVLLHDLREPLTFLEDGSIDLVLAVLVMHYIEDWIPVLREFGRVLIDDGVFVFSVDHPFNQYFHYDGAENYHRVEQVDVWWTGFGTRVRMPSYRRPLQYIAESLNDTGFLIERIVEAQPTIEYQRVDPEGYEKVSKRPSFLCIKAIRYKTMPS
jgi:SAM-dependent methyltransferase